MNKREKLTNQIRFLLALVKDDLLDVLELDLLERLATDLDESVRNVIFQNLFIHNPELEGKSDAEIFEAVQLNVLKNHESQIQRKYN